MKRRVSYFSYLILIVCTQHIVAQTNTEQISNSDILKALNMAGIKIHAFNTGEFEKEYFIHFAIDEYVNQSIIKSDTIKFDISNAFYYQDSNSKTNDIEYHIEYIEELKIFSKLVEKELWLKISANDVELNEHFNIEANFDDNSWYQVFEYENTKWKLNEKVALLLCVSSWIDENGTKRLCGPDKIFDSPASKQLLSSSPHYFIISYIVSELEE